MAEAFTVALTPPLYLPSHVLNFSLITFKIHKFIDQTQQVDRSILSGNNASTGGGIQWGPATSSTGATVASQFSNSPSLSSGSIAITSSSLDNNNAVLGAGIDSNGQAIDITVISPRKN